MIPRHLRLLWLTLTCTIFCVVVHGTSAQTSSRTVSVRAEQPWTNTGIDLPLNSTITVTASGTINVGGQHPIQGPSGNSACPDTAGTPLVAPGLSCWSLIGRIGNSTPFYIGSSLTFSASTM